MKVSEVMEMLSEMNPDESVILFLWDKTLFDNDFNRIVNDEIGIELVVPTSVWNAVADTSTYDVEFLYDEVLSELLEEHRKQSGKSEETE
jgi:hypothetical protein